MLVSFVFACCPNTRPPKTKNQHGPYKLVAAATRTPVNPLEDSLSSSCLPTIHTSISLLPGKKNDYKTCKFCLLVSFYPAFPFPVPFQCPSQTPSSGHLLRASTRGSTSLLLLCWRLPPLFPCLCSVVPFFSHKRANDASPRNIHTATTFIFICIRMPTWKDATFAFLVRPHSTTTLPHSGLAALPHQDPHSRRPKAHPLLLRAPTDRPCRTFYIQGKAF